MKTMKYILASALCMLVSTATIFCKDVSTGTVMPHISKEHYTLMKSFLVAWSYHKNEANRDKSRHN